MLKMTVIVDNLQQITRSLKKKLPKITGDHIKHKENYRLYSYKPSKQIY